jgi:hypothetical protein
MIERMHMALKGGAAAEDKARFWVAVALAAATAALLFASFAELIAL